jgi:transcriptional regulator with XRE-family HTH domain
VPNRRTPYPDWINDRRAALGRQIEAHRRGANLSQDDLADAIGMERRSIQRYESGERDPRFADLLLIADALDIHVRDLLG